jgi:DNA-directed RNA polymerase subunit RPC12/RpoP
MVDYADIPPGTVVICSKCGAKNQRTDSQCRRCDANLDEVKSALAIKLNTQIRRGADESGNILTIDDLKHRSRLASDKDVCIICGVKPKIAFADPSSGPCSFCSAPMCRSCMQSHKVDVKGPILGHMKRFGLEFFPGVQDVAYQPFTNIQETFYVIQPGYYLCRNCMAYLHGPEFLRYAKDYYEKTGRMEELAELYECEGLLEDAKRTRQTARGAMSTDLNELIDKLREGGLAVPYKCPSCGANINIDKDTNADGLRFCSYCGTAVNTDALVRVLEASLR